MVASGLPTLPPVFRRIVRRMPRRVSQLASQVPLERIDVGLMALGWLAIAIGWLLLGLSMWATLVALGAEPPGVARLTAAVALAVVAGFLSLVPGGAVVRELVLAQLLVQPLANLNANGSATAVISAVLLRLVWLVAELVISVILYFVGTRSETGNQRAEVPPPADQRSEVEDQGTGSRSEIVND
jgi:uncharacterized membrane protein YbhN (UPF0104 family)